MKPSVPSNLLTIYGRKPVMEALEDYNIHFFRVHLADSNKPTGIVKDILQLCQRRNIEVVHHDRMALSRISKNRKQDQGVAADIVADNFRELTQFLAENPHQPLTLLGLENITNPQNLGMIIRAVCAGYVDGLVIPKKGCARLDALVIKASAGTLFKAPILFCDSMTSALQLLRDHQVTVYGLALKNSKPLPQVTLRERSILLLGNETEGLSAEAIKQCDECVMIPMRRDVESLNVAVTAGILAFLPLLRGPQQDG